ncbi:N-6 DNA methylase [Neisseria musculi]|nr:N-6 DNA methylase [Neisseria musculi]
MRQHNVSGRENAFDKLVNIFLAKIKDESENPNNLKVYWKGAAQDNYFDLQDRLQELYKKGMDEFLGEEITHVTNNEIEDAFALFKNKKDETKRTILEKFKEIKYYTNNDFAFLDVHNRPLFFKNGAILKEVVQMLQDIKLKTDGSGQNQFLGDLFEGFLDQGVKQSEGQFFTPMPIVRFLVSSLPLENLIKNGESVPKMIDYACGSGHFLNEYATQIRPIINQYKNADPAPYYAAAYGIEKEYRLSKVAKVSAFMYGQDGINIVYGDGLTAHNDIQNGAFSVLVANPPYSVKGFLDTLSEEEREAFALYRNVKETDKFNAIETFFIERAAQLLQQGGVAAIILPSSVLSNDKIYIKAREILLQRFDIVAIAEFGSSTFGKTPTNTVTLFLRRKGNAPSLAEHYQNRVDSWFDGDNEADGLFEDSDLLVRYYNHCGIDESEYLDFLKSKKLPENGIFADYRAEYEKSGDWKAMQKKRDFKRKSTDEKQAEFEKRAFDFAAEIEKDKLRYFMLAAANPQPVLIIKSPSESKAAKTFLGYEWSTRKGSEGIRYIGSSETENEDEDNPNRNQGIFKMQTPLFNPNDLADSGKLNHLIRHNFQTALTQKQPEIPEHLKIFASLRPLHEMLDFSRTKFDKAIQTALAEKVKIVSKYPLVKLKDLADVYRGVTYAKTEQLQEKTSKIILPADNITLDGRLEINKEIYLLESKELDGDKRLKKNDIFICFSSGSEKHIGKLCLITEDTNYFAGGFMGILRASGEVLPQYLFNVLNLDDMRNQVRQLSNGSNIKNLSSSIGELKVPKPPEDVQNQIIAECQKIDQEYESSRMSIEAYRAKIAQIFSDLEVMAQTQSGGVKLFKIKDLLKIYPQKIDPAQHPGQGIYIGLENIEPHTGKLTGEYLHEYSLIKSVKNKFSIREILFGKLRPNLNKVWLSDCEGICSTDILVLQAKNSTQTVLLSHYLRSKSFNEKVLKTVSGQQLPRTSWEALSHIQLALPNESEQKQILAKIADYEAEITKLEQNLQSLPARKQAVLEKYLN